MAQYIKIDTKPRAVKCREIVLQYKKCKNNGK